MSKQQKRNKRNPIIILVTAVVGLTLLAAGGIFSLKAYHKYQANKIYSVSQTMHYPDFSVVVTKAEAKPVNLPVQNELVKKYGGLDKDENCDTFSKASTMTHLGSPELVPYGPSDYNLCVRRNESRQEIKKYSEANRQLVVNYRIAANETVTTSQLKVQLIPDSGRKLNKQVDSFICNEFIQPSTSDFIGIRNSNNDCYDHPFEYNPYFQSDIGENISKGLTRSGYLYTDVRNSENSVDFILSYYHDGKNNTRTTRIDLAEK
ncbi:MAG TPA: hypothetical protein VGF75_02705 [Candidatus Saccharimonadales bacterium]|jgi:hypothetical protein